MVIKKQLIKKLQFRSRLRTAFGLSKNFWHKNPLKWQFSINSLRFILLDMGEDYEAPGEDDSSNSSSSVYFGV